MRHKILTHPQKPSVVVAEHNVPDLVAISQAWLESAFDCAVGYTMHEVLERFSDELRAALAAHDSDSAQLSGEECLGLVRRIQVRMSIAAEWAERIDEVSKEVGLAQ